VIVVDASVMVTALADDGRDGESARSRLGADGDLHAPHLVDLEVASAVARRRRMGNVDDRRAALALRDLYDLPIVRYPHFPFLDRIWELVGNMTPYDAAYVALAETLGCILVTADKTIRRAGGFRCEVEVLG
jgi:predicted nucleic acid-binding protein